MLQIILAIAMFVMSTVGVPTDKIVLCGGIEVNNVDQAVHILPSVYLVLFSYADANTFVLIIDECWPGRYRAIELSSHGTLQLEF